MEITGSSGGYCQIGRICLGATATTVDEEMRSLGFEGFIPGTTNYQARYQVFDEVRNCQATIRLGAGTVNVSGGSASYA